MFTATHNSIRNRQQFLIVLFQLAALVVVASAIAAEPRVANSRYKLELIAKNPEIVTPIGMAFDRQGRLLVVESQTHLRAAGYEGPESDRIRMYSDSNGDGKLDKWSTFADGFRHAMNVLVRDDGAIYVVTRNCLFLLRDTNGDGVADKKEELLRLETKDDYPHNALSGIARDVDGSLVIGFGENHGLPYTLTGADGTVIKSTGGQDGFYRMTADGKNLRRFARGVWNPFSLCVLPDGRIFAVDNDPDASPPCRMLHVVPGGDYGYLFQYGRAGTHPLQAWNGELPGTLPYVCGVGEAPTAIVPYAGRLWVTSWGDHRIERYQLEPRGASYGARRDVIVQGDADFRPTGLAVAPDGSMYFGDWVLRDYPVHGRGRIWRLTLPVEELRKTFAPRTKEDLAASDDSADVAENAASSDPFAHARGVWQIAQRKGFNPLHSNDDSRMKLCMIEALRVNDVNDMKIEALLRESLTSDSLEIRLFAVRWIADDRMKALRDDVARLLEGPQPNPQLYMAVLGAIDWLDRKPNPANANFGDEILVRELKNKDRSPAAHTLALAYLKPDNKFLSLEQLHEYLQSSYEPLRLEAVRSLAQQSNEKRFELLTATAEDNSQPDDVRAEAIVGLAGDAQKDRGLLEKLAASDRAVLRGEAIRSLRLAGLRPALKEEKPPADDLGAWYKLLASKGDAAAGRRIFFNSVGARCSVCHKHSGRGGNVGPDLTHIGGSTSRERIITSILQPSREIAPDYQPWTLVASDGKTYTGLRVAKAGDSGKEEYVDSSGKTFTLASSDIDERRADTKSIMPENLQSILSIDDLRDLVTFLTAGKAVR